MTLLKRSWSSYVVFKLLFAMRVEKLTIQTRAVTCWPGKLNVKTKTQTIILVASHVDVLLALHAILPKERDSDVTEGEITTRSNRMKFRPRVTKVIILAA